MVRLSAMKQEILLTLHDSNYPLQPKPLAEQIERDRTATNKALIELTEDDLTVKVGSGVYALTDKGRDLAESLDKIEDC